NVRRLRRCDLGRGDAREDRNRNLRGTGEAVRVAVVGVGGLGSSIARGLVGRVDLVVCDRHPEKLAAFSAATVAPDPATAAKGADVVVLCVKPKDIVAVANA